jgi:hypothetical protein
MTILFIMIVFIISGLVWCWCFDLWPFNPYTKNNYEQTVKYLKTCSYPYQEISYDVFVSAFPYLDKHAGIKKTDDFYNVGEHIIVNLPREEKKVKYTTPFRDFYIPEYSWERCQRYILLFPDYKQHEQALAYLKEYRNKAEQMRVEKDFTRRSSVDVLKYCQDAIQKDIEATQKKMADACEDIKEKVKEINNV